MDHASLIGKNIVVLDLETAASADDCRHCRQAESAHLVSHMAGCSYCPPGQTGTGYERIGWGNKVMLGLAIGCYWDYQDGQIHWFDRATLAATVEHFVARQPLLVSFNGIQFDFALMRALLRHDAEICEGETRFAAQGRLTDLCDAFKAHCATSYDLLAEIWKIDPLRKFERGLNSLDALCKANGLPAKEMDGATAPRLWQQGRYAEVIQYNVNDVLRTKALFEKICNAEPILRSDGHSITLPFPDRLI
jgi:Predicted 3'-5' exonuclease related to the exonuclease domain of PolB